MSRRKIQKIEEAFEHRKIVHFLPELRLNLSFKQSFLKNLKKGPQKHVICCRSAPK